MTFFWFSYNCCVFSFKNVVLFTMLLLLFLQEEASAAWVVPQQRPSSDFGSRTRGFATSDTRLYLESISLDCLGEDHEAVGSEMASSVQRWLDAEWMTQDVHLQMGKSCQRTYVSCRESGKEDLTDIMLQVADDLMENWDAYDKDAFVNAYDISNYVSDFLTSKVGGEGCDCNAKIF